MRTNTKESVLAFLGKHLQAIREVPHIVWVGPVGTEIIRRRTSLTALQEILVSWPFSVGKFVDEVQRRAEAVLTGQSTLGRWTCKECGTVDDSIGQRLHEAEPLGSCGHGSYARKSLEAMAVEEKRVSQGEAMKNMRWNLKHSVWVPFRKIEAFLERAREGGQVQRVELLRVGLQGDTLIVQWDGSHDCEYLTARIFDHALNDARTEKGSPRYVVQFYRRKEDRYADGRQWFSLVGSAG